MKTAIRTLVAVLLLLECTIAQQTDRSPESPLDHPVFTTIDFPGAFATRAIRINNSGRVVGSFDLQNGQVTHAFFYSDGSMKKIDPPRSEGYAEALGINSSDVVVGTNYHFEQNGFIYINGKYQVVSFAPTINYAAQINDQQVIVGVYAKVCCDLHGYRYEPAAHQLTPIDYPDAVRTMPLGINNAGVIVGTWLDSTDIYHGFIQQDGTLSPVDVPGAIETTVFTINNAGTIGGYFDDAGSVRHGFLLRNGTFTTVDVPGSAETIILGINDLGVIAGAYFDSSGISHGFIGHL